MHKRIIALILTRDEEIHIRRCIENVNKVVDDVYVLDSMSTDNTALIAAEMGAKIIYRKFDTYSSQINWAIEQLADKCDYILRIDADEILDPLLKSSIQECIKNNKEKVFSGWRLNRRFFFLGRELIFGGLGNIKVIRIIDPKCSKCNSKIMDEKFIVNGMVGELRGTLLDWNLKPFCEWLIKHVRYSSLEANQYNKYSANDEKMKIFYYAMPAFLRAFLYFIFRYIILLGFLDGRAGYVFHLFQCFFYRSMVDIEIVSKLNDKKNKHR